ncbi:MAG: nucleoside monophosphate kinase [Alphaproteobacteria bacterium]|nr:nucleoside monophosphate kinase [Alphaproteobacteria bacterium]
MKNTKSKMVVFMGGQGSGKGTHSTRLIQDYNFQYVQTGELLRKSQQNSSVNKEINNGQLANHEYVFNIVKKTIEGFDNQDVILDGFPRTKDQAKWLVEKYSGIYEIQIVYLYVNKQVMLDRIQNRIKENTTNGGKARADDLDPKAVEKRIGIFYQQTLPAIKMLENIANTNHTITFSEVDVNDYDFAKNYKKVCEALELLKQSEQIANEL